MLVVCPGLDPGPDHVHVRVREIHQVLDRDLLSILPQLVQIVVPVELVPAVKQLLLQVSFICLIVGVCLFLLTVVLHELAFRVLLSKFVPDLLEARGFERFEIDFVLSHFWG